MPAFELSAGARLFLHCFASESRDRVFPETPTEAEGASRKNLAGGHKHHSPCKRRESEFPRPTGVRENLRD